MILFVRFGLCSEQVHQIELQADDPSCLLQQELKRTFGVPATCQKLLNESVDDFGVWPKDGTDYVPETVAMAMVTLGARSNNVHATLLCDPSRPISHLTTRIDTRVLLQALSDLSLLGPHVPNSRAAIWSFVHNLDGKDLFFRHREVIRTAMRALIHTNDHDTLADMLKQWRSASFRLLLLEEAIDMNQIDLVHSIFVSWPGGDEFLRFFLWTLSARNSRKALIRSIETQHIGVFETLLDSFSASDMNMRLDSHGNTALMYAAWYNSLPIVLSIMKKAKNACNKSNDWGESALQMAHRRGHSEVVQLLQEAIEVTD